MDVHRVGRCKFEEEMSEFFSFQGRIQRSEYAKSLVVTVVLFIIWVWLANVRRTTYIMNYGEITPETSLLSFLSLVLLVATVWFFLAQSAKRLHDIGLSAWFVIVFLALPVSLLIALIIALIDGKPYENKYGPDPKGRDEKNA